MSTEFMHIPLVEQIKYVRSQNNELWCKLLELALCHPQGKLVVRQITENDQKISELMKELAK